MKKLFRMFVHAIKLAIRDASDTSLPLKERQFANQFIVNLQVLSIASVFCIAQWFIFHSWIANLIAWFILSSLVTACIFTAIENPDPDAMLTIGAGVFLAPALVPLILCAMLEPILKNGMIANLNLIFWIVGIHIEPVSNDWTEYF